MKHGEPFNPADSHSGRLEYEQGAILAETTPVLLADVWMCSFKTDTRWQQPPTIHRRLINTSVPMPHRALCAQCIRPLFAYIAWTRSVT